MVLRDTERPISCWWVMDRCDENSKSARSNWAWPVKSTSSASARISLKCWLPWTCLLLSSDYEGSPLSVVEAMAAGLPVVSTRAGGVPELIEDGREGLLVQPGDVKSLSAAMVVLAEHAEARQSMGMAGARRARDSFDVSEMVRAYEELYETLHADSRNRRPKAVRESAVPV